MKIIAINGSPKKEGNTFHALGIVTGPLKEAGFEVEVLHIGGQTIKGCTACGMCAKNKNERCVIETDSVNEWIQKIKSADALLIGSPVHYSGISAGTKAFLDRAFYVAGANGNFFRHKIGAGLVAVRRSGGTAALDQLYKYLLYSEMLLPTSNYWAVIHGAMPGEVLQDAEGVQILETLGKNMAWLLNLVENGKGKVEAPEAERKVRMNFIR
jgi:multimeric flavodoxin WrbA